MNTPVFGALEAAESDNLIRRNPARNLTPPKITKREMRFLDLDEIAALSQAIEPRYHAMVHAAAYAGLRFGELAALRVTRVDMLRRSLRVEEALTEVQGRVDFGPPKSKASRRRLTMPKALVETLAAHMARYPNSDDGLIFTSPDGRPLRASNFRHRIWAPAVQTSVGPPCRFHDLRHSHAALLIREGVHAKVIQERLGHASIKTTLDTYGHLFEGLDEAAADALDAAITDRDVGFSLG